MPREPPDDAAIRRLHLAGPAPRTDIAILKRTHAREKGREEQRNPMIMEWCYRSRSSSSSGQQRSAPEASRKRWETLNSEDSGKRQKTNPDSDEKKIWEKITNSAPNLRKLQKTKLATEKNGQWHRVGGRVATGVSTPNTIRTSLIGLGSRCVIIALIGTCVGLVVLMSRRERNGLHG